MRMSDWSSEFALPIYQLGESLQPLVHRLDDDTLLGLQALDDGALHGVLAFGHLSEAPGQGGDLRALPRARRGGPAQQQAEKRPDRKRGHGSEDNEEVHGPTPRENRTRI